MALGEEPITLIDSTKPQGGWTFDNGREFPGAVGKLVLASEDKQPTLQLHGDFSAGGMYVQAAKSLPESPIDTVAFDILAPRGVSRVTTRLIDGTGQCHQLSIRLNDKGGWQRYTFPVARYFESVAAGAPMDIVTRYENWSGANDGKWHQPAKLFVVLAGKEQLREGSIALRNVVLIPSPPTTAAATTMRLDRIGESDTGDWQYNNGNEFKGAKGGLASIPAPSSPARGLSLRADFSAGGRYVGARRRIGQTGVTQTNAIHLQVRSKTVNQFSLRLVDGSGQTHQRRGFKVTADGKWHAIEIDPQKVAGGEHWGGANDGKWHGAAALIEVMLAGRSAESSPMTLDLADIWAEVVVQAQESQQTWRETFDQQQSAEAWRLEGDAAFIPLPAKQGGALRLKRELAKLQQQTSATGPLFAVSRGAWKVRYRYETELHSPDNSFHGAVTIDVFDPTDQKIESIPLGIGFGKTDWKQVEQTVALPTNAASARFRVELQKTYGQYLVDDLFITRLNLQTIEPSVESIRIASAAVGNLFFPGDAVEFQITVPTAKPLDAADRIVRYSVQDYRGEVQYQGPQVSLQPAGGRDHRGYETTVSIPADKIRQGQFYELHVEVPQGAGSPANEFSGFAVLPEAASKQFKPNQIPFSIRNWDGRVKEYFYLADRLGLRTVGVWGGWSSKPPYKPHLPGVEICEKLGLHWVTGTPASTVEREGFGKVTEESLRQGMTNFLEAYADRGLARIAQGNEPHGEGQKVIDNVRAYRANYEAVKAFDPQIEVIGTSVEPNEAYFKAGYQRYLDSYDFHIYEHYTKVRRTMRQYRELMKKYDAVKPIHSTELGLNSQGQARLSVAIELIKKCTVFFAEGGETVSWFTIQYPDPQGKARGQFGDAHCVFDCKFNNFNPRLDAIAYYNIINALTDKRFVSEEQHPSGVQQFFFQNDQGDSLQIIWNDEQSQPFTLPLPIGTKVEVVRIDGQRTQRTSTDAGVTIDAALEPVLVLYKK